MLDSLFGSPGFHLGFFFHLWFFIWTKKEKKMNDEPFVVKTSAEFNRLSEALEWGVANCCQGPVGGPEEHQTLHPMIVISRQTPYVKRATGKTVGHRTFVAVSAEQLPRFVESFASDDKRHLDEVVPDDAPCKFAIDCDWRVERLGLFGCANETALFAILEQSFSALVQCVINLYRERYAATVTPCISSAIRVGKWSKHVIFDGAIWRTNRHCLALARELVNDDVAVCGGDKERSLLYLYIDRQIYEKNHTLRMYRSSKVDEPKHSFRIAGELSDAPVDRDFLHRTMITLFPVKGAGDGQQYYITSLFARRFAQMLDLHLLEHPNAATIESSRALLGGATPLNHLSTAGDSTTVGSEWTREFIRCFKPMGAYEAEPDLGVGRMRIRCLNHNCAIKGAPHRKENICLQIDLLECMWRQSCFKLTCRKTPTAWQPLPDALIELCETIYQNWDGARLADDLVIYKERMLPL